MACCRLAAALSTGCARASVGGCKVSMPPASASLMQAGLSPSSVDGLVA